MSTVERDWTVELRDLAQASASRQAEKFGVETEDVFQELMLWILQHKRNLDQWDREYDLEKRNAYAQKSFLNVARRYAARVKVKQLGYQTDVLAWYTRKIVEELLPSVYDYDAWMEPPAVEGDKGGVGDPSKGGNWITTLADISTALDILTTSERDLLQSYYHTGLTQEEIGEALSVSHQTISNRLARAVDKVVDALGGERPDPEAIHPGHSWGECVGSRKVMTNSAALALTARDAGKAQGIDR